MPYKIAGLLLILGGVGLCYYGWRLENKDKEEDIDEYYEGPMSGRGGIIVLVIGAILIFFGILLLIF